MTLQQTQSDFLNNEQAQSLAKQAESHSWRALNIFTFYRVSVIAFLLLLVSADREHHFIVGGLVEIFFITLSSYLAFAFLCMILNFKHWLAFRPFVYIQFLFDILFTVILLHVSGGLNSGMSMLLIVTTVSASLLLSELKALLFPALATLLLLTQQTLIVLYRLEIPSQFPQAGLIGAACFAGSYIAVLYSQRLKETEQKSAISDINLQRMERLNEQIIRYMRTGVLVVDNQEKVQIINQAAWKALATPDLSGKRRLEQINPVLAEEYRQWRQNNHHKTKQFRARKNSPIIKPQFTGLDQDQGSTLILIEDRSLVAQQAQSMKLTSLGRLTASIAHEIRNPLSSINHAAELLIESSELCEADKRLSEIIHKNAVRMNSTIESIMQISQKKTPKPVKLALKPFIENFKNEFIQFNNASVTIELELAPDLPEIFFDPNQLEQVLTNLVANGSRYSKQTIGEEKVVIRVSKTNADTLTIDVIDFGPGVALESREKLFEPFYTTETTGTGLGLYLSQELCEGNQAQLHYKENSPQGACFRITVNYDS